MKREIIISAGLLAGAAYLWHVASNFRRVSGQYETLGPSFFPKLILGGIAILALVQLVSALIRCAYARRSEPEGKAYYPADALKAIGLTALYAAALHWVGFLVATVLFQAALLWVVFKGRDLRAGIGIPLGLTALLAVIFVGVMDLPLPRGVGIFRQISQLVY